jgi:hypothetical protein
MYTHPLFLCKIYPPPLICNNMQNMQNKMQDTHTHPFHIRKKEKHLKKRKHASQTQSARCTWAGSPGLRFHNGALYEYSKYDLKCKIFKICSVFYHACGVPCGALRLLWTCLVEVQQSTLSCLTQGLHKIQFRVGRDCVSVGHIDDT